MTLTEEFSRIIAESTSGSSCLWLLPSVSTIQRGKYRPLPGRGGVWHAWPPPSGVRVSAREVKSMINWRNMGTLGAQARTGSGGFFGRIGDVSYCGCLGQWLGSERTCCCPWVTATLQPSPEPRSHGTFRGWNLECDTLGSGASWRWEDRAASALWRL